MTCECGCVLTHEDREAYIEADGRVVREFRHKIACPLCSNGCLGMGDTPEKARERAEIAWKVWRNGGMDGERSYGCDGGQD